MRPSLPQYATHHWHTLHLAALPSSATATISEDGSVFTFGCGKHNMLGHGDGGDAPNQDSPRWVSGLPADCRVASIAVGGMHMLALDTTGTVWSWGAQGRASPVGRAGAASPGVPGKVGGALQGKDIVQVAAGRRHSVALTREGELYTWGGGHYGALGHGSRKDCPEPTLVQGFRSPVIHVSAGSDHTVVLLADGKVFAFGSDEYGQCGVGFKNRAEREPVQVSGFDGKPIVKVSFAGVQWVLLWLYCMLVCVCVCVCWGGVLMIAFSR